MVSSLLVPLALLALLVVIGLVPSLKRRLLLALLGERGRAAVGAKALAAQPDRITLAPTSARPSAAAQSLLDGLRRSGFQPAGSYTIRELGGLPLHFGLASAQRAVAAVYEHPKAGVWFEIFSRFEDGTSFTFSSRPATGLDQRPGHPVARGPGLAPAAALARFLAERPAGACRAFEVEDVAPMFADAYAESLAWRKTRGVSADEVRRAGMASVKKR